jgi:hypothetical protein
MALSGSKNYTDTYTAANIIELALRRLGVLDPTETIDATEQADALEVLNLMIKEWSGRGIDIWLRQSGVVFVTRPGDKSTYLLGPTGDRAAFSWWETEVVSASGTSLVIAEADTTHTTNGSFVGTKLDDGDIFFTTISAGGGTTSLTLTTALPSAASAGNRVYIYNTTSQISRPIKMLYASRITADNINTSVNSDEVEGLEAEIELIGNDEYRNLAQKRQTGPTTSAYYEPTLTNGTFNIWPTGNLGPDYNKININYLVYADDFDLTTNNAQFPPEWHNTIAWNLAAEMTEEYGLDERRTVRIVRRASFLLEEMLDNDVENASVIFTRDYQPGVNNK